MFGPNPNSSLKRNGSGFGPQKKDQDTSILSITGSGSYQIPGSRSAIYKMSIWHPFLDTLLPLQLRVVPQQLIHSYSVVIDKERVSYQQVPYPEGKRSIDNNIVQVIFVQSPIEQNKATLTRTDQFFKFRPPWGSYLLIIKIKEIINILFE